MKEAIAREILELERIQDGNLDPFTTLDLRSQDIDKIDGLDNFVELEHYADLIKPNKINNI